LANRTKLIHYIQKGRTAVFVTGKKINFVLAFLSSVNEQKKKIIFRHELPQRIDAS